MAYCRNCGKEVDDKAVFCPYCGVQTGEVIATPTETNTLGILAIVFSLCVVFVGFVLAVIGLCTYKLPENKQKCKIALGIVCAWFVIFIIFAVIMTFIGVSAL